MGDTGGWFATAWLGTAEKQRTLVVVGLPRSGTSMAARALHELGVDMGRVGNATYEDADFVTLINELRASASGDGKASVCLRLQELIARRDDERDIWGFKVPGVPLPGVVELLRRPALVVVHRDIVSICGRMTISEGTDFIKAYRHFSDLQKALQGTVASLPYPRLFVSYEKALSTPQAFVSVLARFAGVEPDDARLEDAAASIVPSPPDYVADTRGVAVHGNLDGVFNGRVMGWAARPAAADKAVTVRIVIDGRHRFEVPTRVARPDVTKHLAWLNGTDARGIGDKHGFEAEIPAALRDGQEHEVMVEVVGTEDFRIGDSPKHLVFPVQ